MASSQSPDEARPESLTTESKEQAVTPKSPDEARLDTLTAESKEQAATPKSPDKARPETLTTESKEQAATPKSPDEEHPETLTTESKKQATTPKSLDEERRETLTTEPKEHEIASTPPNEKDAQPEEEIATEPKTTSTRPHLFHGSPSQIETQYVNMLLAKYKIHAIYNALAGFFTWILLAGFILFPGTFTSLQKSQLGIGTTGEEVLNAITHVPL